MACAIEFYNLSGAPIAHGLAPLLQAILDAGGRAVVIGGSEERIRALDAALWTYDPASFLPHGTAADGNADLQPVWLTVRDENPNGATAVVVLDDAEPSSIDSFERCLYLFDATDPQARDAGRARFKRYKDAGAAPAYGEFSRRGWRVRD